MARTNEWSRKVLALLKGGNAGAALAQIKAAPGVGELKQLRAAMQASALVGRWPNVDETVADQIDALSAPRLHRSP